MSNSQENNFNQNLTETNIKLIGDNTTICQVVLLLSYIRHAIKNNIQTDINVKIGKKVANGQLLFDVNGLEIPDMIIQDSVEIN
jgi:hypothetical protein